MTFERERDEMVVRQLQARGIRDARVLEAMRQVPRHRFVDAALVEHAHDDSPLPIGEHQTISQPFMVALMSEALDLHGELPRVLEIGTGSGYQAAVLAELGLDQRVRVIDGDGTLGWPAEAAYDGIVVTAGAPQIPRPLLEQLALGGCLVLPMGEEDVQTLVRLRRGPQGLTEEYFGDCRFVKLRGAYGWSEP